jgi:hypothetical protein
MSDSIAANRANTMPINQAALARLNQAKTDHSADYPYLIQLGLWGLETLDLTFPRTGASKQDVEDFLWRLMRDSHPTSSGKPGNPVRMTKLLCGETEEEVQLTPRMLLEDDPEDAALIVVNQALFLLNTA